MSSLSAYWLPRPPLNLDDATRAEFDQLYASAVALGTGSRIDYHLAAPKWQFLAYLGEHYPLVLHGSGVPDIAEFEPRQSGDAIAFGAQLAVYAAADGVWPMYYAILDRDKFPMTLVNGCGRVAEGDGPPGEPVYFFSITQSARQQAPWRDGWVYLLPSAGFITMAPMRDGDLTIHVPQVASLAPVKPLAKLAIRPADFPFWRQIRGHDDEVLAARIAANPNGFPWVDPDEA